MAAESVIPLIDHTLLKPDATAGQIETLCRQALEYGFASVCVNPCHVARCARLLAGSPVAVCTVIGFPLGASASAVKAFETARAIEDGALEVDMVINIGALKDGDFAAVSADIAAVCAAARGKALVKVILECCLLSDAEIVAATLLAKEAGADFVKTSTGFSSVGADARHVALMARTAGQGVGVKASGGIRSLTDAQKMIKAGATRLGCSSGVEIAREEREI